MNGQIQGLKADIAQCKKAASLLDQAINIMRSIGYVIETASAEGTIKLCLERKRRELGEMVESDPPTP